MPRNQNQTIERDWPLGPKQKAFVDFLAPRPDLHRDGREAMMLGSEQGGKTVSLIAVAGECTLKHPDKTGVLVGPTYPALKRGVIPKFMEYLVRPRLFGSFNETEHVYKLNGGGAVYFCSAEEPDETIVAVTADWAGIDEAGKCSFHAYMNTKARLKTTRGILGMATTPYGQYGWTREWTREAVKRVADRLLIVQSAYDNPSISAEEIEEARKVLPPYEFARRFMGEFAGAEGLVYENFLEEVGPDGNLIEPFPVPPDWEVYAGLDWGYSCPSVCVWHARKPGTSKWYIVGTVSVKGEHSVTFAQMVADARGAFKENWFKRTRAWYFDPTRPDSAALFRQLGFNPLVPGRRGNERVSGIHTVYRLVGTRKLKVFSDQREWLRQRAIYHWPRTRDEKDPSDVPQDYEHDTLDCSRYVLHSVPDYNADIITYEKDEDWNPEFIERRFRAMFHVPEPEDAWQEVPIIN